MRSGVKETLTFHLLVEKEVNKGGEGREEESREGGRERREKGWFE